MGGSNGPSADRRTGIALQFGPRRQRHQYRRGRGLHHPDVGDHGLPYGAPPTARTLGRFPPGSPQSVRPSPRVVGPAQTDVRTISSGPERNATPPIAERLPEPKRGTRTPDLPLTTRQGLAGRAGFVDGPSSQRRLSPRASPRVRVSLKCSSWSPDRSSRRRGVAATFADGVARELRHCARPQRAETSRAESWTGAKVQ